MTEGEPSREWLEQAAEEGREQLDRDGDRYLVTVTKIGGAGAAGSTIK